MWVKWFNTRWHWFNRCTAECYCVVTFHSFECVYFKFLPTVTALSLSSLLLPQSLSHFFPGLSVAGVFDSSSSLWFCCSRHPSSVLRQLWLWTTLLWDNFITKQPRESSGVEREGDVKGDGDGGQISSSVVIRLSTFYAFLSLLLSCTNREIVRH